MALRNEFKEAFLELLGFIIFICSIIGIFLMFSVMTEAYYVEQDYPDCNDLISYKNCSPDSASWDTNTCDDKTVVRVCERSKL